MAEHQQKPITQKLYDSTPTIRQTVKFLTAAGIGTTLLVLSGLTLTATILALVLATPVLVIFSPILVPAAVVLSLVAGGFLFSSGFGAAAVAAAAWVYKYVKGRNPVGADEVDMARTKVAEVARDVKERVKE